MNRLQFFILTQVCLFSVGLSEARGLPQEGEQETVQEKSGVVMTETRETPQYPIHYLGFIGSTYMYQTDCCSDGHGGVLYSDVHFSPAGCGAGGPLAGGSEFPPPGLALPFSTFDPATDPKMERAFSDRSFNNKARYPFGFSRPDLNVCQFGNYYPAHDSMYDSLFYFGTVVRIRDSDGDANCFSLVRVKVNSTNSSGNDLVQEFPLLIAMRTGTSFKVLDRAGIEVEVTPEVLVKSNLDQYPFDCEKAGIHLVKIMVPAVDDEGNPKLDEEEEIDAQLVVRPIN